MVLHPRSHGHRSGFTPPPSSGVYRNIAFTFLGLTVIVVIGALWVSSVYARVTVKVKHQPASIQTSIDVAKSPEEGQLRGRVVQGVFEKIQEFTVSASSGTAVDAVVNGTVKIINDYSKPQTLVATTRLLTADGRLYRIDKTVTVEPKQSVTVIAHSDKPGKIYTLPKGTRFTIPGLWTDLQKWIYAESVSGFTGGETLQKVVTAADVSDAEKSLEDAVFEEAQKTLQAEAGVGPDWKAVYVKKIISEKTNTSPGDPSDKFLASVKLDVTAIYYPDKDMAVLIRQKLKDKLSEGQELTDFDPSQVLYKIEQSDSKLEKARIAIMVQATSQLTDHSPQLQKDAIMGLSVEQAKSKLQSIDGVESVEIKLRPSWINKLPTNKEKIEMVVE
jgi:hypothetical protein